MKFNKEEFQIEDKEKKLAYPLKKIRKNRIEVFSLLDVLSEYVGKEDYSLVCFIDHPIAEVGNPDELAGRACGDRVAAVNTKQNKFSLCNTVAHELLHTLGFDHCNDWLCLMNPYMSNEVNYLCP